MSQIIISKASFERSMGFIDHDPGEPEHVGTAREATTSGLPAETPSQPPLVSPPSASDPDRTAAVLNLKAQHAARGHHTEKPPSRYYCSQGMQEVQSNAATFAERRASRSCFAARSPSTLVVKTLLEPTWKRTKLKEPVRSAISWNRAIENSRKDHLYRENSVMPSKSLRPAFLSRVTKCTPK